MRKQPKTLWVAAAAIAVLVGIGAYKVIREPPIKPAPTANVPQVTVTIYDEGAPLAGRWVIFHWPDGTVLGTAESGQDGKATGPMVAGGMITVAYGAAVQHLVTIAGVDPDDTVVVGEKENDEAQSGVTATVAKITVPGTQPSATRYGVDLGAGLHDAGAGATIRVPVLRRFLDPEGRFPVVGTAFDADGGARAYSYAQTPASDGGETDVSLPPWSTSFREEKIVLAHVPDGFTSATGDLSILMGERRFDHRAVSAVARETTLTFELPAPLGDVAAYRIELASPSDRAILVQRNDTMPAEVRLDLGETLLPRITSASIERGPNPSRPTVRWTAARDASAAADATILQVTWPMTKEHTWTVIAPPTLQPGFQLPALPRELATWRPDDRPSRASVAFVEASAYSSWADVKKSWIHLLGKTPEAPATIRISMNGEIDF